MAVTSKTAPHLFRGWMWYCISGQWSFHTRHHLWTEVAAMIFSSLSQYSYSPGSVQAGSPSTGFSFCLTISTCFGSAFLLYYLFSFRSSRLLYFSFILVALMEIKGFSGVQREFIYPSTRHAPFSQHVRPLCRLF